MACSSCKQVRNFRRLAEQNGQGDNSTKFQKVDWKNPMQILEIGVNIIFALALGLICCAICIVVAFPLLIYWLICTVFGKQAIIKIPHVLDLNLSENTPRNRIREKKQLTDGK